MDTENKLRDEETCQWGDSRWNQGYDIGYETGYDEGFCRGLEIGRHKQGNYEPGFFRKLWAKFW